MRIRFVLSSILIAACSVTSYAADLPSRSAPVLAPAPLSIPDTWSGAFVGLSLGGALFDNRSSSYGSVQYYNNVNIYGEGTGSFSNRNSKILGAVQLGFNYKIDSFVLGAFSDVHISSVSSASSTPVRSWCNTNFNSNCVNSLYSTLSSFNRIGPSYNIGARGGILLSDSLLVYALAGYSGANVKSGVSIRVSNYQTGDSVTTNGDGWRSGFIVGAGIESKLTDDISIKAEYRYADYGKMKIGYNSGSALDPHYYVTQQSARLSVSSVVASLSYKFWSFK